MNASTTTTMLTGLLSLCLFSPAMATDFSGSLKGVTITDSQAVNKPPVATFTYTVNGNTVSFDAGGSNDPDGTIAQYKWFFGDGQFGAGVSTTHTYASKNNFPVTLTLIDNSNGITLYNQIITSGIYPTFIDQSTEGANYGNIWGVRANGQGLFLLSDQELHSITIKTGPAVYGTPPPPAKARFGYSADLSSSYLGESEEIIISQANTEYTFVFPTTIKLKANTQYYFSISCADNFSGHWFNLTLSPGDSYRPDGCKNCNFFVGSDAGKWNASTLSLNKDLYFKVK